MSRVSRLQLAFSDWPAEDRRRWQDAFKAGDRFDENSRGANLARSTRAALQVSYAEFLRFISTRDRALLVLAPDARLDRQIVSDYVACLRKSREDSSIAISLHHLRHALRLICPDSDWSWLLTITKRIAAAAPRKAEKYSLVTSDRLYALGIELMDRAVAGSAHAGRIPKASAVQYRDGLVIALLALIPLRRRTLAALRIGKHLVKVGDLWALEIPAADTKTRRPLDYPISKVMSQRIDLYLDRFRCCLPAANTHTGLWPSNQGCSLSAGAIYAAVYKRTEEAFGFGVNLHQFRHAAATFWSTVDPVNVRGAKDLLGQASFTTMEKHYIMGRSRIAGRALAHALEVLRE